MKNAIMLSISGTMFLFEDNDFTIENKIALQELARNIEVKRMNEGEVFKHFMDTTKNELGIDLHEIKISFVMRINI
jgi:hypothetical protein